MKLDSLSLVNFRNINEASLQFHDHLNIFIGKNGQGKTNVIESIVFLSSGRSFRVLDDKVMIRNSQSFAKIEGIVDYRSLSIVLSEEGKYLKYNNRVLNRLSEFIGLCNVVLFNPDDLQFFNQAPRKRRREIDFELGKSSNEYVVNLSKVNALISERNAFLKSNVDDMSFLDVIDEQIVMYSKDIMDKRLAFIKALSWRINKVYRDISGDDVSVELEYVAPVVMVDDYIDALRKRIRDSRGRDLQFKSTHIGIHRDDYVFKIDGKPVIHVMSQGQRRILMVAYKIGVIEWFIEEMNQVPIFCMDDLFSELDSNKREAILSYLNPLVQVFITTTDIEFIRTQKDRYVFAVDAGVISKEEGVV